MTALRTLFVWVLGLASTTAIFLIILICSPIDRRGGFIHSLCVAWSRIILLLSGVRVDIKGVENVPRDRPVIFMSNHQGAFDIPALQARLPVRFSWIAKKSLFDLPIVGWSMRLARYIPIDRENPAAAMKSMEEASRKISAGTSVVVFPEGTRSATGELLPFKRGAFMLAKTSGVTIVPVAISGTNTIMKKGGYMIRPAEVKIVIGKPISVDMGDEKGLRNMTRKAVEGLFREARASA